jgi:oxygen-independent coproporphyrinogen-3 oxidase
VYGIYIHVPFCAKRCPYCAFVLIEADGSDRRFDDAVVRHLDRAERVPIVSVYFGGGTPSLLEPDRVARLVDACARKFEARGPLEITLEANPEGLDAGRLRGFRDAGVTRLSIGAQSLDDAELRFLGRAHDAAQGRRAFRAAREAGFGNVVVDVIFGCPTRAFARTLDEVIAWGPEHVSIYGLTVEKGTELERSVKRGLALPGDVAQKEDYELAMDRLGGAGYRHYELSNFARPGFESRHNSGYWDGRPYLGFGPGAHSYVPHRRWASASNVERYLAGEFEPMMVEELTPGQRMLERIFLGLRREEGIDAGAFEREFGVGFRTRYAKALGEVDGCVEWAGTRLRLTRRGRLLADAVIGKFA